jgi:hypothetical protein
MQADTGYYYLALDRSLFIVHKSLPQKQLDRVYSPEEVHSSSFFTTGVSYFESPLKSCGS